MIKRRDQHILVVDDEVVIRHLLCEMLQGDGYDVTTAQDGAEGLACYHRDRPDLVISDTHMPRMDGPTLIKQLRVADPSLPIVVLNSAPDLLPSELEPSPRTVRVSKPFDLAEIRDAINRVRSDHGQDHGTTDSTPSPQYRIEMVEQPGDDLT